MRIVVCCKQVPDTSVRLRVEPGGLEPQHAGLLPVLNPYDEFALEEALGLRRPDREVEIVLLTLASEPVDESVFHGLAMGADRAIVLRADPDRLLAPGLSARLLAAEIGSLRPELVFCGERAVDDEAAQVGPAVAETLGLPQICGAESVELDGTGHGLRARCRRPGSAEIFACELPCLVSFVRGERLPRYPSLDDVFAAGEKPVDARELEFLPDPGPPHRVALTAPREERAGETIAGEPGEAVRRLLEDPHGIAALL